MPNNETVWTQCLFEIIRLNSLRGIEDIEVSEVDRLAALVAQDIRVDASFAIKKVVADPDNKFDNPIPF